MEFKNNLGIKLAASLQGWASIEHSTLQGCTLYAVLRKALSLVFPIYTPYFQDCHLSDDYPGFHRVMASTGTLNEP